VYTTNYSQFGPSGQELNTPEKTKTTKPSTLTSLYHLTLNFSLYIPPDRPIFSRFTHLPEPIVSSKDVSRLNK